MKRFLLITFVLLALSAMCFCDNKQPVEYMLKKYPELFNRPKAPIVKTKTWSEGTNPPEASIGLQILDNIRQEEEEHHANQTHASNPELTIDQIEGPSVSFIHEMPLNTQLGVGIASNTFSDKAWLIGGTPDSLAYEKLIAGAKIDNVLNEVYSFKFEHCGWTIEKPLPHGNPLAFATAVHYSHPACTVQNTTAPGLSPPMTTDFIDFCGKEVMVVFGGTNGTNTRNTVWYFDMQEKTYTAMTKPAPMTFDPNELNLAAHTAIVWSHYMIVVGGLQFEYGKNVRPTFTNKIWVYDFETQYWTEAGFAGNSNQTVLPPIAFHTVNVYCSNRFGAACANNNDPTAELWLYGGLLEDGTINEEIYVLHLDPNGNTTQVMDKHTKMLVDVVLPTYTVDTFSSECPRNGTFGHASVVHGDHLYVFGGARYKTSGTKFPIPLAGQQTVVDPTYTISDELWRYDFINNQWFNITEINPWILSKFGLVLEEFNDRLYFFAGLNEHHAVSTGVHSLNLATGRYEFSPCCAPGYEGKKCENPICSCGCGGENVGKCVAPDQCECLNGFTGEFCSEHACDAKYGYNLVSLNSVVFYPTAADNLLSKIKLTLQKLEYIKENLPRYDSRLVNLDIKNLAQSLNEYNEKNVDLIDKLKDILLHFVNN